MASQKTVKTGLPLLIDSDVANTLDFHISSTSLLNIIDEYANYIAASYVRNHQRHTSDPVYNDAWFFWDLNYNVLNLKTDTTTVETLTSYKAGSVNVKVQEAFAKGAYLSKLDTLLTEGEIWIRDETGWPESRGPELGEKQYEITWASGRKEIVSEERFKGLNLYRSGAVVKELPRITSVNNPNGREYRAVNLVTGIERWIPFDEDIQALVKAKLNNLEDRWGLDRVSDEFLLYWNEKFRRAHHKTREQYTAWITDDKNNYFTDLSDSIGSLTKSGSETSADFTSIPIIDYNFEIMDTIPSSVNPVAFNKLDEEAKALTVEMTLKTESLYRKNLSKLIRVMKFSDEPHGEDLTVDYLHWSRMIGIKGVLDVAVADTIGKAYKLLGYMETAINEREVKSPVISLAVEDTLARVNLLKTAVQDTKKSITNSDVLEPILVLYDQS